MSRIVYMAFPTGEIAGGQKMILRHVETLRDLGFEAVVWITRENTLPSWLDHRAPVEVGTPIAPDDILVLPDDAPNALATAAALNNRLLVFCQNQFSLGAVGVPSIDRFPPDRRPGFLTVGPTAMAAIRRLYPAADTVLVPCFADERIFRPGAASRTHQVAHSPRKRPLEAVTIRNLLPRLHVRHAHLPFAALENASERQMSATFAGSTLFLSLSRFESVGMTPLEAMACGAVVAGFTGIGGWDYATPHNGFWAPEDHVYAATDALAQAADLVLTGGAALEARREAGYATAEQWSYARFRAALEETWMRLAPEVRRKDGPLD